MKIIVFLLRWYGTSSQTGNDIFHNECSEKTIFRVNIDLDVICHFLARRCRFRSEKCGNGQIDSKPTKKNFMCHTAFQNRKEDGSIAFSRDFSRRILFEFLDSRTSIIRDSFTRKLCSPERRIEENTTYYFSFGIE